jgi:5-methylthioribose kinase
MDLGFFLSHLILKAVKNEPIRGQYFDLTRSFWRTYSEAVTFQPAAQLMARGIGHFGVCLLARIDGTSPVDYLPEERRREVVRRLGRKVLLEQPRTWDEVLHMSQVELARG